MALKRRVAETLVTGTTGDGVTTTAQTDVGLGAAFGKIIAIEIKGNDGDVDVNNTFAITDANGRLILKATAVDAGADDSTLLATNQDYSTVGVYYSLIEDEARGLQSTIGAVATDNVGSAGKGVPAKSPVTISLAAGTDGDEHQVVLWVEV